jgi:diamine N-acetyltransferase
MIDYSENTDKPLAVGAVDLFEVDPLHRRAGVGILVNLPYREKGVAGQAMEILVKYAFETLNLHQLYCNISADNAHSIRLFEKLGFLPCGLKKDWILDGGRWKDEWIYQLLNHAT